MSVLEKQSRRRCLAASSELSGLGFSSTLRRLASKCNNVELTLTVMHPTPFCS